MYVLSDSQGTRRSNWTSTQNRWFSQANKTFPAIWKIWRLAPADFPGLLQNFQPRVSHTLLFYSWVFSLPQTILPQVILDVGNSKYQKKKFKHALFKYYRHLNLISKVGFIKQDCLRCDSLDADIYSKRTEFSELRWLPKHWLSHSKSHLAHVKLQQSYLLFKISIQTPLFRVSGRRWTGTSKQNSDICALKVHIQETSLSSSSCWLLFGHLSNPVVTIPALVQVHILGWHSQRRI